MAGGSGETALFGAFFFALWANFGTTVRLGFSWIWGRWKRLWWAGVVFGLVGGPLGYLIGERIGAVTIAGGAHGLERWKALGIIGLEFALMMTAWFRCAGRVLTREAAR